MSLSPLPHLPLAKRVVKNLHERSRIVIGMKSSKKYILCLLLTASTALAVVDIAPEEVETNSAVSGNIALSYSSKDGNTEKDEYDGSGKIKFDSRRNYLAFIQGTYEKTISSDVTTENETLIHARYLYRLNQETVYAEVFGQYHEDVFQGIDERWLTGGGLRWRYFYDPDVGKLYIGFGAFAEDIRYTADFPGKDETLSRFNSYLAYTRQLSEKTEFSLIGYFQPAIDDVDDYYTAINAELTVHVVSDLHLSLIYEMDRDSQPPEGIEKMDRETKVSLVWKF